MDWELTKLIDIKRQEYANNRDEIDNLTVCYRKKHKWTSVFHASVPLETMNFKDRLVDPQSTFGNVMTQFIVYNRTDA